MSSFEADPSPAFDRWKATFEAAAEGKDEFALVDIGLNPAFGDQKVLSWVRSGMVTVGIGGNEWAQGGNKLGYASFWHLPGSTLTVDGKPVVENGELKP